LIQFSERLLAGFEMIFRSGLATLNFFLCFFKLVNSVLVCVYVLNGMGRVHFFRNHSSHEINLKKTYLMYVKQLEQEVLSLQINQKHRFLVEPFGFFLLFPYLKTTQSMIKKTRSAVTSAAPVFFPPCIPSSSVA
jgi:hypothetical protein